MIGVRRHALVAECRVDRQRLDRVAELGACAVRLDIADGVGLDRRIGQRRAKHGFLRRAVGRGQAVAATILVERRATNDRDDGIAVGAAHPPAASSTMTPQPSPRTKPSARASNALQRPSGAIMRAFDSATVVSGSRMQVDAAGEGQVALATAQALHRDVDGDERGGAGRVDRQCRPARAEHVSKAARRDAVRGARGGIGVEPDRRAVAHAAGNSRSRTAR